MSGSSWSSFAWAFVVAAGVSLSPGCGGGSTLSQIEQGKAVTTKEPALDDFFRAVVALREEVTRAEGERNSARAELGKALALEEDADATSALDAAQAKAKKLAAGGTSLHLLLTPEVKLLVLKPKRGKPSEDPAALAKAVEESVKASLDFARRMGDLDRRAQKLEAQRSELSLSSAAKQGDAPRELDGARVVLADVRMRAASAAGLASSFVIGLATAVETGAADAALARLTGKAARPAAGGGGRPSGGGAPAQGAPAPRPKPSDDFEP